MKRSIVLLSCIVLFCLLTAESCMDGQKPTSDQVDRNNQEKLLQEATRQIGMPAIKNFRQKKLVKMIVELCDQMGLVTYTYTFSQFHGKFIYLGQTIGYPIPYSTQLTNPMKIEASASNYGYAILPQADPDGLFKPAAAEGTWVLMKDPNGSEVKPVYMEERVECFPFKLPANVVMNQQADKTEISTNEPGSINDQKTE